MDVLMYGWMYSLFTETDWLCPLAVAIMRSKKEKRSCLHPSIHPSSTAYLASGRWGSRKARLASLQPLRGVRRLA